MKDKDLVSVTRAIAIMTVICAHVSLVTRGGALGEYFSHVLANIGTVGVGIFYLISGYNFLPEKYRLLDSIKLKFESIVMPWVYVGTMVWLYIVLRKGGVSFAAWLKFIIGYQSYLYFLTNLLIFYLLFYLISRIGNKNIESIICIAFIPISYMAIIFEFMGLSIFPNFYLDPFIFIGYFSAGYLLRRNDKLTVLSLFNNSLWLISFILPFIPTVRLSYARDVFVPIYETMLIVGVFSLGKLLVQTKIKDKLVWTGKQSMAIYLLHMPFAGIIANIFNRFSWAVYIDFTRPILTLILTITSIRVVVFFSQRLNVGWMMKLMGIRNI